MYPIKISVINVVYNVENYLRQCLDSVVNQTLKEIEIICVNDGSTDNSLQILEEYAKKDDRIMVISKENGGISSARNMGLEYVNGEYTGFIDSDDWAELDMYEKLYRNAKLHDSDMVMFPAQLFDDINKELRYDIPYFTLKCFDASFYDRVFTHIDTEDFLFAISVTPWNKIYKSKFLKEIGAKFPEGLDFDDNPFFYETYLNASKVSLVRDSLYFYRINREGSFITSANERYFDIVEIYDQIEEIIRKTDNQDRYITSFSNVRVSSILSRYRQVDEQYKKRFFEIIKRNFIKMNPFCIANLNSSNTVEYQFIINSDTYREFELRKRISNLEEEIETLKKEYQIEINYKKQLIHEITSSNSWKLTKPLRKFRNVLKRNQ